MPEMTYFSQECPTCGRRLQIRVKYLGRTVRCSHCGGTLVASESNESIFDEPATAGSTVLKRADELLRDFRDQMKDDHSAVVRQQ